MKNECLINWPLLKKWNNEFHFTGLRLVLFILWCVMLLFCSAMSALLFIIASYLRAVFFLIMALFCAFKAFFHYPMYAKSQYKRFVQTYGKESWMRTTTFEDEYIVISEEKSAMKYAYSDVISVCEKGDTVYIRLKGNAVLRLYKQNFIDCTWQDCRAMILFKNPDIKVQ